MQDLLNHINTQLNSVNTLKEVAEDEGQLEGNAKVTLRLPAAYYDITDANYGGSGKVGFADTEITVRLGFKLNDATRFSVMDSITKAIVGTSGTLFTGILKESFQKVRQTDIKVYHLTFGTMYKDLSAVPVLTKPETNPEPEFTVVQKG